MVDSIGKRIAFLRQKHGWTQQSLADRLAMSRVAISHIEMDLTIPSERSITLMAGVFKLSPNELVAGTSYPAAKAERLPGLTATHTDLELMHALLCNDVEWLGKLNSSPQKGEISKQLLVKWCSIMDRLDPGIYDEHEAEVLRNMRQLMKDLKDRLNHQRV